MQSLATTDISGSTEQGQLGNNGHLGSMILLAQLNDNLPNEVPTSLRLTQAIDAYPANHSVQQIVGLK